MGILDILDEISRGENINLHVKSDNKHIRKAVAEEGYKLDLLIQDPSDEVRAAVARKGYGLSKLLNDKSDWVRYAVLETIDQLSKRNVGYDIINRIDIGSTHIVMGHNANASSPYVTWEFNPEALSYSSGHYFSSESAATLDLFRRATKEIQIDTRSLNIALLTETDHEQLRHQYRDDTAKEDILYSIDMFAEANGYDYNELVSNPEFMKKALDRYWHLDHSYENEVLLEVLKETAQELYLEENNIGQGSRCEEKVYEIKLGPEEISLYNDLLSLSESELVNKYGPIGDDIDINFAISKNLTGRLCLKQISESKEHPYQLELQIIADNKIQDTQKITVKDFPSGEEISSCGIKVKLTEDENLRRLGNKFIFQTSEEDSQYSKHNGEECTITRALTVHEADILNTGLMWEARFDNGDILTVFDQEIKPLEITKKKPKLSDQIKKAETRNSLHLLDDKGSPER